MSESLNAQRKSSVAMVLGSVAVVAAAAAGVVVLFQTKASRASEDVSERKKVLSEGLKVQVELAKRTLPERVVTVQAEARPYAEVTLYAKVAGYLREIHVDKGDPVKKGQLLARIEAPEVDAQYVASVADAKYKKVNAQRADALVAPGVVSAQDRDVAVSSSEVAAATQQSNETLKGYELLKAPFDGVVTARFADPGALLQNAANAQTGALPIVTVSQTNTLRIYGYLDQRDAPFVRVGDVAEIRLPERPGKLIPATVTRLSGELDPRTRMMLVEVDLDNRAGTIVAGSYVNVILHLKTPSLVELPAAALVVHNKATMVGVVDSQDKLRFRGVEVADDDGTKLRLVPTDGGIVEGERVALNVGDRVKEGALVQPVMPPVAGAQVEVAKPK